MVIGPEVEFLLSFKVAAAVAGDVTAGEVAREDTNAGAWTAPDVTVC